MMDLITTEHRSLMPTGLHSEDQRKWKKGERPTHKKTCVC